MCLLFFLIVTQTQQNPVVGKFKEIPGKRLGKINLNITIPINQYEKIIKSVLSMKHHNYLKQFMVRLFRNKIHLKNITSKFWDSGTICNSCKEHPENRPHFFLCNKHLTIIEKLNRCFINLKILKTSPNITPYFFSSTLSINHPSNLIFISMMNLCTTYDSMKLYQTCHLYRIISHDLSLSQ